MANKKKNKCKYCCSIFCQKFKNFFGCSPKKPYINLTFIDSYIDQYWLINIPDNLSIISTNKKISTLIHELFIQGEQEIAYKLERDKIKKLKN